jgi:polysaccharide deacetylase family protein (PEP-CTERM system associated)
VERNTERLLEILERTGQRATFFCLGWIAERYPQLVRKVSESHEIACHTYTHQLAYTQSAEDFRTDTLRAKELLEQVTGKAVNGFRAAGFSVNRTTPWFFEELVACGFTTDSSVFPVRRGHGGFPGFPSGLPCKIRTTSGTITELPMSTGRYAGIEFVYSGGGYFRLMPYTIIRQMIRRSKYTLTYFHPRDIDPEQPVLDSLSAIRRFKSYYGLGRCASKLEALLSDFRFTDVSGGLSTLNLSTIPEVEINGAGQPVLTT